MPSKKDKFKEFESLAFEDALKRLESIVERMEDGNAPLEELIARFEEGGALAALCQKRLDDLQRKIEILVKDTPQGPKWKQFDPDGGEEDAPDEEGEEAEADEEPEAKASQSKAKKLAPDEDTLF